MVPWFGYAAIAALAIAAVGLLQKKTLQSEHSLEFALIFSATKLAIFFLFFWRFITWSVTTTQLIFLGLDGISFSLAFLLTTKAMRRLELSAAVPVLSLEPALVAILALIFLGEKISGGQLTGLGFVLVGTYVLELRPGNHGQPPGDRHWTDIFKPIQRLMEGPGGHYAWMGLLFFATTSVIDRYILQQVSVWTYMAYVLSTATFMYSIMMISSDERPQLLRHGPRWLLPVIVVIAVLHLTSNLTQAKATSLAAVGLVIAIKRVAVLIDVVLGGRFFHEHFIVQKTLASIIILTGVYFIVR